MFLTICLINPYVFLLMIELDEIVNTIPTIGFNVEDVKYKNLNLTIWDVGGQGLLRGVTQLPIKLET